MSLINEALKKAQRQRTTEETPVAPAPAGAPASVGGVPIVKRRAPMPARTLVILIAGGVCVLLMGGVLAFLFLGADATPAPVIAARPVAPSAPIAPTPASVSAPVATATPPSPAPAALPVVSVKLPAIAPAPATPPPAVSPPPAPVAAKPEPAGSSPNTPTANPRVYEFLETLRIAGIRVSATDPKVIMNDRVFRINDVVDRATQLRLVRVETSTLVFTDASGFEYKKSF